MKLSLIAFTKEGLEVAEKLTNAAAAAGDICTRFAPPALAKPPVFPYEDGFRQWTSKQFFAVDGLIFIGACGIAVRAVAPFLQGKEKDPAVIVVDQKARFVIPLLSGHLGGANELALRLSSYCGAQTVITTGTDLCNVFAVDTWAVAHDVAILDIDKIKLVSGRLLAGEPVGFCCDFSRTGLPQGFSENRQSVGISISLDVDKRPFPNTLRLVPKCVFLGMGCRKGISSQAVEACAMHILEKTGISLAAVKALCTVQLKAEEPALLDFCEKYKIPLYPFAPEILKNQMGEFSASAFVKKVTGVDNICERAAVAGADGADLIMSKTVGEGVTAALAKAPWEAVFP